jgi:hypothetical protein
MSNWRVLRESDFFIIENDPPAVLFQVCYVMTTASVLADMTNKAYKLILPITVL